MATPLAVDASTHPVHPATPVATSVCPAPAKTPARRARVWAVGGGKGGVGKSVVASSLALAFARCGRRVVLIDADLGGANLHNIFRQSPDAPTLNDFLRKRVETLAEVVSTTGNEHLGLISGARGLPGDANLSHSQKQKLIRHLRQIHADDIVLDLSAGSAFNALDFFLAADHGLLVVVPEPTSVENAYHFLHAAFFRALRGAAKTGSVRERIDSVLANAGRDVLRAPRWILEEVAAIDAEAGETLQRAAAAFRPSLIVNKTRVKTQLAWEMRANTRRFLGSELRVLGELPWDSQVATAIERERPVLDYAPHGCFSRALYHLVGTQLYRSRDAAKPGPARTVGLSPGQLLAVHRERQGKSRAEIAWNLRVREGLIRAIEAEDFGVMPSGPYLRSWLTEYSKFLGIDHAERLVNRYLGRFHAFAGQPANETH